MANDVADSAARSFSFGPFVLVPARQLLLRGDVPVRLGSRALDILTTLVEQAGVVVSKHALLARVWPDTTVDESNLKVNMGSLRRALGDGPDTPYIATVVGRGYRFCAPVQASRSVQATAELGAPQRAHNLPIGTTRIFGRDSTIEAIGQELDEARLVSIVGPGGVGKTTVALAVAERAVGAFRNGVWLIDLALLKEPALVPNAIATAIGMVSHLPSMVAALGEHLRDRELLLVLDNCEHVVDVAAACASRLLSEAAGVKILVTSREPLLVNGERVRRLPGLGTPMPSDRWTAEAILAFPAVQLFVDRATDHHESFRLSDADAPAVAEICRRLDGLALAIELAATRLATFGVSGLVKQLDDRLRILTRRRGGPERHRTLTATLDWSYELLAADEAALLRAVAVFAGLFDIDGASVVAGVPPPDAAVTLAQLAEKSLLAVDLDADRVAYRLAETTRSYCLERLRDSGVEQAVCRRHAEHVCAVLERAAIEWEQRSARDWGDAYGRFLDDLRGALAWAGRAPADGALRIRLTVAGILLWNHFALTAECRMHVAQAVAELAAAGLDGTAYELRLQLWLGDATTFTRGPVTEAMDALRRALDIAVRIGDVDGHVRCLRLTGVHELFRGDNDAALQTLETSVRLATGSAPGVALEAETALGIGELFVGRLDSARRRLERHHALEMRVAKDAQHLQRHVRHLSDRSTDAGSVLSHVLWLTGSPDAALRTVEATIAQALATRYHLALTTALSWGCAVAFWTGRHAQCAHYVTMLDDESRQHGFVVRLPVARFYRAVLDCGQPGARAEDIDRLERVIGELRATGHLVRLPFYLGVQADVLVQHGRLGDAHVAIRAALDRSTAKNELWCRPELLRIHANILTAERQISKAEALLVEAMALAQSIGALSWRLRAASDLARLWSADGRSHDAHVMLSPVYAALRDGFATRDVIVAAELLASFAGSP